MFAVEPEPLSDSFVLRFCLSGKIACFLGKGKVYCVLHRTCYT